MDAAPPDADPPSSPLPDLIIQPGTRLWIAGHDRRAKQAVMRWLERGTPASAAGPAAPPESFPRPRSGPIDMVILAPASPDEAAYFARKSRARLLSTGALWVVQARPPDSRYQVLAAWEKELSDVMRRSGYHPASRSRLSDEYMALGFAPAPAEASPDAAES